ncbi:RPA-related protein RADX-like [Uloborus diversus]|uniref:RPA-related protein RADX-like n=1 Tax=Uloborus diversus TaxID=327109 RepID=UPI002409EDC9|nr:RPA-related protein RADX-like [Uloborus diversus]
MAGNLKQLRRLLREFKLISDSSRIPGQFQVIALYCYAADSNFLKALTPPLEGKGKEVIYLHDILLTDGSEKLKCFLALPLGHFVQKNVVKVGSYVEIHKAKMCYLEGEYNDSHIVEYVLLEAIKVTEFSPVAYPVLGSLRFVESTNYREREAIPLVTGRKCYLNPWIPIVPDGNDWINNGLPEYEEDDSTQNICLLQDLADDWMRLPKPYPPIFVRVMARGILHHYGYSRNDGSHPFMARLSVGDSSGSCLCVVFGKLLASLYYGAVPGTLFMIQSYSIKKPENPHFPRLRGAAGNMPVLDMEIVLGDNSRVQIVPPDNDLLHLQIINMPLIEYSFGNRASLTYAANETTIDMVGLITYVSLFHRFMYKFGKLHARCFVELIDSSDPFPFVAIFYDNGQRFDIKEIHPGQVLVATHMKICHLPDELISSHQIRTYLKSTHFTELYITHSHSSPYIRYPAVADVANIIREHHDEIEFLQNNMLRAGGVSMFLRSYKTLESYKESFGNSSAGKMIPGAYWKLALESLIYRERRCVTLGGFIVQVDYVDLQTVDSPDPVYGWAYASDISSRRTLFVNIKAMYKLGSMLPLNAGQNEKLMFPSQYSSDNEEYFKVYRQFPAVDAVDWKPPTEVEIQDIPILSDGYYIVSIASLHYQAILQCLVIPEPSSKPHPSLIDALSGNLQILPLQSMGSFLSEPPRYTWDEVREIRRTASEVSERTFVFAIELHRTKSDVVSAHLQRAYICPPDQISAAMDADRVL